METPKVYEVGGERVEGHEGPVVQRVGPLLERGAHQQGYIPSVIRTINLGLKSLKNSNLAKGVANTEEDFSGNYWDTATLIASDGGRQFKIIFPYQTGCRSLTELARSCWDLISSEGNSAMVDLDRSGRWEMIEAAEEKDGVYTFGRNELPSEGFAPGEVLDSSFLKTLLGHPDLVGIDFSRDKGLVETTILRAFELGQQYTGEAGVEMFGVHLPRIGPGDKVLSVLTLDKFGEGFDIYMRDNLQFEHCNLPFVPAA